MASIGGFQFDNLVQARVPFLLVNFGIDTSAVYPHVFKMHLDRTLLVLPDEKNLVAASDDEIIQALQTMKYSVETAIVVLDSDGMRAEKFTTVLEDAGYKNSFFVRGGWTQLVTEKTQGF